MEQKVIHLKNIPDSYLSVTSGLGEANPRSLLIVPMQYENQIYGVLEFATFQTFESIHITLIEQVAESIASTLSAVKTNIITASLLEESKAQTQTLTSHEEEMRQNMEELQATQEEATRQSHRFLLLEESLNQSLMRAEFSSEGKLLSANPLFCTKFEFDHSNVIGKSVYDLISDDTREKFHDIWKKLRKNAEPFSGYLSHVTQRGKDLWTMSSLCRTRNEEDTLDKIMLIAMDASEEVMQTRKSEIVSELTGKLGIRFDLDINGNFMDYNHHFMHLVKSAQKELKALAIFDLIDPADQDSFSKTWESITAGTTHTGLIRIKTTHGEMKWIHGSFAVVHNSTREINRILFSGFDISNEKMLENEARNQAEVLKKQEKMLREAEKEMTRQVRETKLAMQTQLKEAEHTRAIHERMTEDSPEAIVNTGNDNRILFFNRAAESLWEINRNEVINQDISVLFPERVTGSDEILESFALPGDQKLTGKRKLTSVIDKKGREKKVVIQLIKSRIGNENSYTAFLLPM